MIAQHARYARQDFSRSRSGTNSINEKVSHYRPVPGILACWQAHVARLRCVSRFEQQKTRRSGFCASAAELDYAAATSLCFLRRAMNPISPRPASSIAYVSGSGIGAKIATSCAPEPEGPWLFVTDQMLAL